MFKECIKRILPEYFSDKVSGRAFRQIEGMNEDEYRQFVHGTDQEALEVIDKILKREEHWGRRELGRAALEMLAESRFIAQQKKDSAQGK